MALTVLSIAYPFAPVRPSAVGGAEQILGDLDESLVAAGHQSLVIACEGSEVAGRLSAVSIPKRDVLDDRDKECCRKQVQAAIESAMARDRVDLIHMHGLDFHEYQMPATIPIVVTLHMPIAWYPPEIWKRLDGRVQFCCVSEMQRRSCPPELREVAVVENGVALPTFQPARDREDFAVVMGRICPEKNAHEALQAGTLAGTRVLLAGQVFPYREHKEYFEQRIEPLLRARPTGVQHEFLGPLAPERRRDLLARAKCLLHPTLAPETSSLVAMEALAAGTPVIAYRSGALPEIVEDGVTGFLVDDVKTMAEAIGNARTISPQTCRDAAERRFANRRMVQRYFELYEGLVNGAQRQKLYA
jgi:glycosyltransferase involved in cell wall biosynthesis